MHIYALLLLDLNCIRTRSPIFFSLLKKMQILFLIHRQYYRGDRQKNSKTLKTWKIWVLSDWKQEKDQKNDIAAPCHPCTYFFTWLSEVSLQSGILKLQPQGKTANANERMWIASHEHLGLCSTSKCFSIVSLRKYRFCIIHRKLITLIC